MKTEKNEAVYIVKLLKAWEETYKKGQLSFWILLALKDGEKYIGEISEFIENMTLGRITCEDQSLYRALRKYHDLEMVEYYLKEGNRGPERKYFKLTQIGKKLLAQFIERNIAIFFNKELKELIEKAHETHHQK